MMFKGRTSAHIYYTVFELHKRKNMNEARKSVCMGIRNDSHFEIAGEYVKWAFN